MAPLFDFARHKPQRDEVLPLIRQFASHDAFRSAVVDELELDEDFYRRPLRPEDLDFLKFQKAITAETVSRLPSLATNRLLLCINELSVPRMPRDAAEFERFEQFYADGNQVAAQRIRPYLESYAFSYLADDTYAQQGPTGHAAAVDALFEAQLTHWKDLFAMLLRNDYLEDGLRFILIQQWALAASRRLPVERAAASGYFASVAPADRPSLGSGVLDDALLGQVAAMLGVDRKPHSYWQFYLPTSLAKTNLLHALGSRPDHAFALLGASFVAETEWLAFGLALAQACPHWVRNSGPAADAAQLLADVKARLRRSADAVQQHNGAAALYRLGQGLGMAVRLAERARWDLGEQLRWLSAIPRYCQWAREIEKRIQAECPGIDRETFVEPREMCSTTHVHSDHRLVVIEEGDMLFWGNLGMKLPLATGEMVLIPDGRLHGSTVVSQECTYHQPIIPDEWINELLTAAERPAVPA
nr:peptide synthetase [Bordetella sp. LUAb4]